MHIRIHKKENLKKYEVGILFNDYREIHGWKKYDHRMEETVKIKRNRKCRFILKESG